MKYNIVVFSAQCSTEEFNINGVEADEDDFVAKYDHDPFRLPSDIHGCGDMRCDIIRPTKEVLEKYKITEEEFFIIAEELDEKLSFGQCNWCA